LYLQRKASGGPSEEILSKFPFYPQSKVLKLSVLSSISLILTAQRSKTLPPISRFMDILGNFPTSMGCLIQPVWPILAP
jgi:hypothetical protein